MNGRERPAPQGTTCPRCGRLCYFTIDSTPSHPQLETHSPAGDPYGTCPGTPAVGPTRVAAVTRVNLGRDWHATGYVASLAVGPLSLAADPLADVGHGSGASTRFSGLVVDTCSSSSTGTLSMLIGAFFVGIAGSILTDLWLDRFVARSRGVSAFLGTATLLVGVVSLAARPFG